MRPGAGFLRLIGSGFMGTCFRIAAWSKGAAGDQPEWEILPRSRVGRGQRAWRRGAASCAGDEISGRASGRTETSLK